MLPHQGDGDHSKKHLRGDQVMITLQIKAASTKHTALRRMIAATALLGLTLGVLDIIGPVHAQSGPLCTAFGEGQTGLDSWGACPAAPNIVVTTSNVGSIGGPGDYHLHLRDTSGASAACSTNARYLGDWNKKMGDCGQFCFDFKVFKAGTPPGPITPSFTIWNGPARATFVANFTVTTNDPWRQHICAPVNLAGSPPSNAQGHWVVTGGTWNSIITGVTMIQLPVDFTADPSEEVGYDNICMNPKTCDPPPPVIKGCLEDTKVAVKCNPNGTYTVTLNGSSFSGTDITMTSQTAGVTVTPPQQPWSATTTWTVTGATGGQTVVLTANATKVGGGNEGTDLCCSGEITIVMPDCPKPEVGQVVVEKKVKNGTRASNATINALSFPIGLTCGPPSTLNTSFNLNNGGSHTENNVPYGSLCTVTESVPTLPPAPKDVCPRGSTAVWLPPVIVPASATVSAPVTAFTVVNELQCKKLGEVGSLVVKKEVRYQGPLMLPSQTYPVTVTCGSTVTNLNLVPGVPQTVSNIPLNTSCSIVEGTVTTPPNVCPPNTTPVWSTAYVPPSPLIINGTVTETVRNTLTCKKGEVCLPPMVMIPGGQCSCPPGTVLVGKECIKQPPICLPPMIPGPVPGQCICPPGTVQSGKECVKPHTCPPPLVMGPADKCICPQGTVLVDGKCVKQETSCKRPMIPGPVAGQCICPPGMVQQGGRCVPRIECRSPLIPNAAGTDCVCRPGLVQKGRRCVEPVVCKPPATLNRYGACQCPRDMVARGNSCVERERPPTVTPGIPPRGRDNEPPRGGGDPRGGRDVDPPRGGGRDTDPPRGGQGLGAPGLR
jgi:hypothetical protein